MFQKCHRLSKNSVGHIYLFMCFRGEVFPSMTVRELSWALASCLLATVPLFGPWNLDYRLASPEYCHEANRVLTYQNLLRANHVSSFRKDCTQNLSGIL